MADAPDTCADLSGRRVMTPQGADWQPMQVAGCVLEGVTMQPLAETPGRWRSYWMKMEPGARSVLHRHAAIEMLVVVEGFVEDSDGAVYGAPEAILYPAGSVHLLSSAPGCTLLVVESRESTRV